MSSNGKSKGDEAEEKLKAFVDENHEGLSVRDALLLREATRNENPPPPMTNAQALEKAEALRSAGNDAFGTKDWQRALDLYLRSAEYDATSAKTFSNIAAVCCKLGEYQSARDYSGKAILLDPKWAKG